jgi:hypothetical protein
MVVKNDTVGLKHGDEAAHAAPKPDTHNEVAHKVSDSERASLEAVKKLQGRAYNEAEVNEESRASAKASMRNVGLDDENAAAGLRAYLAYGAALGYKTHKNEDMAKWEDLPASERAAWTNSAFASRTDTGGAVAANKAAADKLAASQHQSSDSAFGTHDSPSPTDARDAAKTSGSTR